VAQYALLLNVTDQSAMLLTQNATASLFTVTVNGVNVQPDVTSVNYTASLQCSSGATNVAFFCGKSPNPSAQQA
jgi:hypothetical protein